ncbi:MAG: hypothetical protein E6Q97_39530 [Desulfurellales bacterium]|nr:MAG: hypothetical protein E6Q97_39530 [Desulfurellales bacterium]
MQMTAEDYARYVELELQRGYAVNRKAVILRVDPRVKRNEPCVCGSGKKFKKCCGRVS